MRSVRWGAGIGALVAVLVGMGASCGDDDDDGGQAAPPPQLDPDPLSLEIQSVTVPDGAAPRPVVRFRVLDGAGNPIVLETEIANWNLGIPTAANRVRPNVIPRFTLAQLDDQGNYSSYYTSTATARDYKIAGPDGADVTVTPPAGTTALQATYVPAARGPTGASLPFPLETDLKAVSPGVYEYTMPPANGTGLDRTKTHTLAGWVVRQPAGSDQDVAYNSFNFVPAGTAPVQRDEVVSDAACNRCHGTLQAHGTRRGVQLCITCHSPQTTDPETGRTVDFQVMVHKIHAGSNLPSVVEGQNYFIVGNQQSVHDWSEAAFPWHDHGVAHCSVCHTGGEDSEAWRTKPSLAVCTSCHDNVKFDPGATAGLRVCNSPRPTGVAATSDCLHTGGAIAIANADDVNSCAGCHAPGSGLAVDRFHHGD